MELSDEELMLQKEACNFVLKNKQKLIQEFILSKNPLKVGFMTLFMAGSPGAGKTEFSQRYIPLIYNKNDKPINNFLVKKGFDLSTVDNLFIRIDVDEIRLFLPQYRKTIPANNIKGNAHVVQKAANKGLDILRDFCLKNEISFLHDGTFGNYKTMKDVINKSLTAGRFIRIYYLYLDPVTAWNFTKAREHEEGRNIIKEKFIEQFFNSRQNIDLIKKEFGNQVNVNCVLKNKANEVHDIQYNVSSIDQYLKTQYSKGVIEDYSAEDLQKLLTN